MNMSPKMECPKCGKSNIFMGGMMAFPIMTANYNCICGFTATLMFTNKDYDFSISAKKKGD